MVIRRQFTIAVIPVAKHVIKAMLCRNVGDGGHCCFPMPAIADGVLTFVEATSVFHCPGLVYSALALCFQWPGMF